MRRVIAIALAGFVCSAAMAQKRVDVSKMLKSPDSDATPAVMQILDQAKGRDVIISFPKGTYNFYPERAYGKYHAVTNHDNSYKYFAFPLVDCSNVTVEGNGSEFIFHGVITPFLVERSSNITLRDFSIDWPQPFYIQGTVIASDPKDKTVDLEFEPFSNITLDNNRITFTANGHLLTDLGETMVFDPKTKAVAYRAADYILGGVRSKNATATHLGGLKYRIKGQFQKAPPVGLIYVFKGPNRHNRMAPGIHLSASEKVLLENIDIYHACGMGVIGETSGDITLRNVNTPLREGSSRIVTTTADATHFCNCKGKLLIENCLFENMLDDATNVHGTYVRVASVDGNRSLTAKLIHPQQLDYDFAGVKDLIQFVDSLTILPKGKSNVVSLRRINQNFIQITFADNIPLSVGVGDGLENLTRYPEFIFRNNIVRNNRARSILISTARKTVVENNFFSSMMSSILFEGDLNHWHESGAVNDVLIQNNRFGDSVYGGSGRGGSIIWINPHIRKRIDDQPYERNIRIINNTFRTFDSSVLNALSVDGLVFEGNTIEPSNTYTPINPQLPTIKLEGCINSRISDNTYTGQGKGTIMMDKVSTAGTKVSGQKGFE